MLGSTVFDGGKQGIPTWGKKNTTKNKVYLRDSSEKAMATHSSTLAWKSHGRKSLVGCRPWGLEESDTTKRLHFHFSLSCTGEGNGTHFSVLAWRTPGTVEPGGLPSMGSHRVGHD